MKQRIKSLLLPFYFGSIDEKERFLVERELLSDAEYFVDYLDLKRNIEAAREIPQYPSKTLWHKLRPQMQPKRKVILSLGFSLAACLVVFAIFFHTGWEMGNGKKHQEEILFDSSSELPANSYVL